MNYYDILGVKKNDDLNTIKKAYKRLAAKYHPDKHPGDSSYDEKFKQINQAYEILGNQEKRKEYDLRGTIGGSPFGKHASPYDQRFDTSDMFNDIFNTTFRRTTKKEEAGKTSKSFEYSFTSNGQQFNTHNIFEDFFNDDKFKNAPKEPITVYVKLNKEESKDGTTKDVFIEKLNETIKVRFPADSLPGRKLKIKHKNNQEIIFKVKNFSNKWKFEGDNVKLTMPIEKFKNTDKVKVKTIEGKEIFVKVPEGLHTDTTLRLKGMGWTFKNGTSSDLLINIK